MCASAARYLAREKNNMMITFIGGGNMASALIGGLLRQGFNAQDMRVMEISVETRDTLAKKMGIAVFAGMLGVTLFGLFLTPVFYVVVQGVAERLSRRRSNAPVL